VLTFWFLASVSLSIIYTMRWTQRRGSSRIPIRPSSPLPFLVHRGPVLVRRPQLRWIRWTPRSQTFELSSGLEAGSIEPASISPLRTMITRREWPFNIQYYLFSCSLSMPANGDPIHLTAMFHGPPVTGGQGHIPRSEFAPCGFSRRSYSPSHDLSSNTLIMCSFNNFWWA